MAAFLAQEWLDLQRAAGQELPPASGVSATVQHVVTGAPDGNVLYTTTVEDGRVVQAALGKLDEPDLTFTVTYEVAQRMAQGELEMGAAYMQGALKAEGDMSKLLPVLELTHHPEYRAMVAGVAEQTEF
jgi:alkyl sulfatase BDS1-like metallo-beta-lactamase superfamily hydrolase